MKYAICCMKTWNENSLSKKGHWTQPNLYMDWTTQCLNVQNVNIYRSWKTERVTAGEEWGEVRSYCVLTF